MSKKIEITFNFIIIMGKYEGVKRFLFENCKEN